MSGPGSKPVGKFGAIGYHIHLAHQKLMSVAIVQKLKRRKKTSPSKMEIQGRHPLSALFPLQPLLLELPNLQYVGKTPRQYIQHSHYHMGKMHVCLKSQVL